MLQEPFSLETNIAHNTIMTMYSTSVKHLLCWHEIEGPSLTALLILASSGHWEDQIYLNTLINYNNKTSVDSADACPEEMPMIHCSETTLQICLMQGTVLQWEVTETRGP